MYMVNIWQVPRGLLLEVHRGKSHLWQTVQKKPCLLWLHVECLSLFPVTQIPPQQRRYIPVPWHSEPTSEEMLRAMKSSSAYPQNWRSRSLKLDRLTLRHVLWFSVWCFCPGGCGTEGIESSREQQERWMLSVEQEFRLTVSGTLGTKTFQKHRGYERPCGKESIQMSKVREKFKDVQGSSPAPSKPKNGSVFGGVESNPTVHHRKRALCPDHAVSLADSFTSVSKDNNTCQASGTLGIADIQLLGLDLPRGNKKQEDARKGPI